MKAVWGFDPEEIEKVQAAAPRQESVLNALIEDNPFARIPRAADAQIYELCRMFRL